MHHVVIDYFMFKSTESAGSSRSLCVMLCICSSVGVGMILLKTSCFLERFYNKHDPKNLHKKHFAELVTVE